MNILTFKVLSVGVVTGALLFVASPMASAHTYCDRCHTAGLSDANPASFRMALCLDCHGPGGVSSLRVTTHANLDCADCHEIHGGSANWLGGENLKVMREDVDKTAQHSNFSTPRTYEYPVIETPPQNRVPVVFESRGSTTGEPTLHSFADGDEDGNGIYDGICEVCHLDYMKSRTHYQGETCTTCHPHNRGFGISN